MADRQFLEDLEFTLRGPLTPRKRDFLERAVEYFSEFSSFSFPQDKLEIYLGCLYLYHFTTQETVIVKIVRELIRLNENCSALLAFEQHFESIQPTSNSKKLFTREEILTQLEDNDFSQILTLVDSAEDAGLDRLRVIASNPNEYFNTELKLRVSAYLIVNLKDRIRQFIADLANFPDVRFTTQTFDVVFQRLQQAKRSPRYDPEVVAEFLNAIRPHGIDINL